MALFGSVVRNEQTDSSDIDIAYEGKADILLRCRMKQELEALLGCKVDIIRLREQLIGTDFLRNISKDLLYVWAFSHSDFIRPDRRCGTFDPK